VAGKLRACPYAIPDPEAPYKRRCILLNDICMTRIVNCPFVQRLWLVRFPKRYFKFPKVTIIPKGMEKYKKLGVKVPEIVVSPELPSA